MTAKRVLLIYLVTYLTAGGIGLAIAPDFALDLLQSNQDYGEVMPRVVGMFMVGLAGLIGTIVYYRDYKYYPFSAVVRTVIVLFLFWLYTFDQDPLFLVFNGIVLVGLIPSYVVLARERTERSSGKAGSGPSD